MLCRSLKQTEQFQQGFEAFRTTSMFGDVFFVSKSLLEIVTQKKLNKMQFCPESPRIILEYWYIERDLF